MRRPFSIFPCTLRVWSLWPLQCGPLCTDDIWSIPPLSQTGTCHYFSLGTETGWTTAMTWFGFVRNWGNHDACSQSIDDYSTPMLDAPASNTHIFCHVLMSDICLCLSASTPILLWLLQSTLACGMLAALPELASQTAYINATGLFYSQGTHRPNHWSRNVSTSDSKFKVKTCDDTDTVQFIWQATLCIFGTAVRLWWSD